ncbi:MAG: hypothetical protein IJU89_01870 [Alphaproteobacteria bacterium]|nr:hypothetical protein [Alphaproteobacteria bacterium]MBR6752137.1 hypothetical protein [Alphaproteobacteria bacterium]
MRLRATILKFLLFSCVFCCVANVAMADTTKLASVGFVEGTIKRDTDGSVRINNSAGSPVTLSQNPQTSGSTMQTTSNKEVPTIGWTDANRTSKVKTGTGANAQLVDMWIE